MVARDFASVPTNKAFGTPSALQPASIGSRFGGGCLAAPIDVRITIVGRWLVTCVFRGQRSAWWRLDNCHADKAVTNAKQLAGLLSRSDLVGVVKPG